MREITARGIRTRLSIAIERLEAARVLLAKELVDRGGPFRAVIRARMPPVGFLTNLRQQIPAPIAKHMPILQWGPRYSRDAALSDLLAAVIVTIMLIPQSLAYAMLAGLPAHMGLYASVLPLVVYSLFGTSTALAVGPVAVISLMTAAAVGKIAAHGTPEYVTAAVALAFLSGLVLLAMAVFRLGFLANLLSHPVISGFISASGIIIAAAQLKHVLGINADGENLLDILRSLLADVAQTSFLTLAIGVSAIALLFWARHSLKPFLLARNWSPRQADIATKVAPVAAVALTTIVTWLLGSHAAGVKVVGQVPQGLPPLTLPSLDPSLWTQLLGSAILISVIGFVESVSVAQTLAAKRRQRISPNQELIGLGAANVAASISGGFPVTGGFARSVVNFDAGASTPAAGAYTAVGILLAALLLTPFLYYLPQATLAATIIVAVLSLVDLGAPKRIWSYSRSDFRAMAATILVTLFLGVERGIMAGVALSIVLHLWRTSRPHCAIVGQVPGTEHFRNVNRHRVVTSETVITLRVDESLYFANARFLEDRVADLVASSPRIKHVVLMCPAVNHIDASALESLEGINRNLKQGGVTFHLSEVKGPIMDRLKRSHFLEQLAGRVFLSQYEAFRALDPDAAARALAQAAE